MHVFFFFFVLCQETFAIKSVQFKEEETVIRDGMEGTLDMTVKKCKEA